MINQLGANFVNTESQLNYSIIIASEFKKKLYVKNDVQVQHDNISHESA